MVFDNASKTPAVPVLALGITSAIYLALSISCSKPDDSPTVGSNTNWLTPCEVNSECVDKLQCYCGACSKGCSVDGDCAAYAGTACVLSAEDAAVAQCRGEVSWSSPGICLPRCSPGGCAEAQTCTLGACVPRVLPSSDFCATVSSATAANRTLEEQLAEAVEQARASGGIDCGTGTVTGALGFVRVDPRLTCAARVLAQDLAATGARSFTDSAGRTTTDRLALVGYTARSWAEGFTRDMNSASTAITAMLGDAQFCSGLASAAMADIGVGHVKNVYVVTMGAK
jgi:uncharacterized protein YkwD